MKNQDCIFCKIAEGKIPAAKVYEDKTVIGFLDIMPANQGHCLIIPKKHYEMLIDIPDNDLSKIMIAAKKIAKALSLATANEGYNIVMNNGKVAGQVVFHSHLHVIPRFKDDGHNIKWEHMHYQGNQMHEMAEKIKKFISE